MTEIEIRNKITGVVVVTTAAVCTGYYQSVGFKKTSGFKFFESYLKRSYKITNAN